jgi:hypothetical protein
MGSTEREDHQPTPAAVERARVEQDRRLTALFRRWPRLSRRELGELRRLHDERIRLARHVGRLRRRSRPT